MLTKPKDLHSGTSYWQSLRHPQVMHAPLTRNISTDIVIIGAGITGAMAAQALSEAGFKVVILDRRSPLAGATSATTALLQYEIDNPFIHLSKQIGAENAMRAWRRSKLSLESLKAKLQSLGIRCGMQRKPTLYLAGNILDVEALRAEGEARNRIGLYNELLTRHALQESFGISRGAALRSYHNITVDPLRMAAGFLKHAALHKTIIYAPVTALDIEESGQFVHLQTDTGHEVKARHLIYATGYEIPKQARSRKRKVHSTYAITTCKQPGKLWPQRAMIWEASDPYLYVRTTRDGRVICGGGDEEFENEEKRDALLAQKSAFLSRKLQQLFPQLDTRADFAWTGSFGSSDTGLPSIGALPGMKRCYGILAFGGNGITYSRIAAELLTSLLTGKDDPEADIYAF